MARLARVVIPGMPHHITQRGNRRQPTFFCEEDYAAYLETAQTPLSAQQNAGLVFDPLLEYAKSELS